VIHKSTYERDISTADSHLAAGPLSSEKRNHTRHGKAILVIAKQPYQSAVKRVWHTYDSQDQILASDFRYKQLKRFDLFPLGSEAVGCISSSLGFAVYGFGV